MFDGAYDLVGVFKRHIAVQAHVRLDGYAVADATGAEIVRLAHLRETVNNVFYLAFGLFRKGTVREFAGTDLQQVPGNLYQHCAHHDGCQRIQHRPALSEQDGAAYAYGCTYGRKGVAAVMPGVGHHGRGVQGLAPGEGVSEENFLDCDRQQCCPQGQYSGHFQRFALQPAGDFEGACDDDADGGAYKCQSYQQRGQSLVFAVAVVVVRVLRLGADANEYQNYEVCEEIRQRVHGVGHHCGTAGHYACHKLEAEQHQISYAAK